MFDDSKAIMNELKKMDLTDEECFVVAKKILFMPHQLHMFWGYDDANCITFVKSLM